MMESGETIADLIQRKKTSFTRSERQLANTILENYPVSALGSITSLSRSSKVSNPTIVRLAKKLGFSGFAEMQTKIRSEVEAEISNPITRHNHWAARLPDTHLLNMFADTAMNNIRDTLARLDPREFDKVTALLSDKDRQLHIVGGRITRSVADYFFTHLQMIRDKLVLIPPNTSAWPHYILSMKPGDIIVIFDIRRYEREISRLADTAKELDLEIILFTDRWGSPISRIADCSFHTSTEAPSAWDSNMMLLFIAEAVIAAVQNETWEDTHERMKTLEHLFDRTNLFKKLD